MIIIILIYKNNNNNKFKILKKINKFKITIFKTQNLLIKIKT